MIFRLLVTLEDHWDTWLGVLSLDAGSDPRTWDLARLLAAWEVQLQRGAKDETEWRKTRAQLYAPLRLSRPRAGRQRVPRAAGTGGAPSSGQGRGMAVSEADALVARLAMADSMFGAG